MAQFFHLNRDEREELFRQDPATRNDGGFQRFMVSLQQKYRPGTEEIRLEDDDIDDIRRHATKYLGGGWEERLTKIFSRHLGPSLGRETH
ncbi:MAG: aspartyl-tRNA synthetase [Acidobacteria bacterium]|nr:MAG: aspartyl-tRNA synthetase [Acidobacteriota bacterium]